jgi:glycosyltransferase involved in cell wall biosynthesis
MLLGKKIVVVMPAYNAATTLRQTYSELPHDHVDEVILVDDASVDETARLATELGIRAFTREVIETLPLEENSDDFVFDNEMLAQAVYFGFRMGEISCPAKHFEEASSINFSRSVKYGFGVLGTTMKYVLQKRGLISSVLFNRLGKKVSGAGPGGTEGRG